MKFSIKIKLLFLFFITIITTALIVSVIYFQNLKSEYLKSFYKESIFDMSIVKSNINNYENKLKHIAQNITETKEINSILNLISNYQNINNYNAELFDEEKKKLLQLVNAKINTTNSFSYGILDKHKQPVIINRVSSNKRTKGIFTYKKSKLYFLALDTNKLKDIPFLYKISKKEMENKIVKVLENDNFSIRYTKPIYNNGKLVGYFRIKKVFSLNNIDMLINNLTNKFSFLSNSFTLGNIENIDKTVIIKNTTMIDNNVYDLNELIEDKNYFYHSHYINTLNDKKLYITSAISKKEYNDKITNLIQDFTLSIILATFISFILVSLFLKKTLFNRINELSNYINDIKQKKYTPLKTDLADEIDEVIEELNILTHDLQDSFKNIENLNSFLQKIIDTVPVRIFWKDRYSKFLGANKLFLNDANLDHIDKLIGKTDYDMCWVNEANGYIKDDLDVMENKKAKLLIEEQQTTSEGDVIHLLTSKVPLLDDHGNIIGVLGVYEDITEHKKAEKALKEKDKILYEQSKLASMGEMIGNIAHQWRQPLSIITTSATGMVLQKQIGQLNDAQFEKTCDLINENAQYLSKTIDDFKNFIKGERKFVHFHLKEQIESFLNLVQPSIKRHNLTVILNLDDSISLQGYPNELIQCYMNIFNNAKDVLKESAHHRKLLFISSYIEENKIIIKFRDNAGGIPKDVLPRIFEPYFTTKHASRGTGLGLHMTYKLITEGMKSTIIATNENYNYEGEFYVGAEFTIKIPILTQS